VLLQLGGRGSAKTVDSVSVLGKVPGGGTVASSNTVAWYPVHRSVYSARVNLVFVVMVYAVTRTCVNRAHLNSNMRLLCS